MPEHQGSIPKATQEEVGDASKTSETSLGSPQGGALTMDEERSQGSLCQRRAQEDQLKSRMEGLDSIEIESSSCIVEDFK